MTGYTKLVAPIEPGGVTELENLARRCHATAKILAELAVRQLLVAAQAGTMPAMPPLDPDISGGLYVWLKEPDLLALGGLAEGQSTTAASLASLAVRHMLAQARAGALPMLTPLKPPEPDSEPASAHGARANFIKARMVADRLHLLVEWGLNEKTRAFLKEAEDLYQATPF